MNRKNRSIVRKYLRGKSLTPLQIVSVKEVPGEFSWCDREVMDDRIDKLEGKSLEVLVADIIHTLSTEGYATIVKSNRLQCHSEAARSARDIWRVLEFYRPGKYSIFDVMNTLGDPEFLCNHGINFTFCTEVERVVFFVCHYDAYYHGQTLDEFGLTVADWRDL